MSLTKGDGGKSIYKPKLTISQKQIPILEIAYLSLFLKMILDS